MDSLEQAENIHNKYINLQKQKFWTSVEMSNNN